jgi:hypothetical protein
LAHTPVITVEVAVQQVPMTQASLDCPYQHGPPTALGGACVNNRWR